MSVSNHPFGSEEFPPDELEAVRAVRRARPSFLPEAKVARIEHKARHRLRQAKQLVRLPPAMALRWAFALGMVFAMVWASAGTVSASESSLPGEALYPVKRLSENVWLALTPAAERPALHLEFAGRRLAEIEGLAGQGEVLPDLLNDMTAETEAALSDSESLPTDQQTELLTKLSELSVRQQSVLEQVQLIAPAEAQGALQHAQEASQHGLERAQEVIQQHRYSSMPQREVWPFLLRETER